MRKDVRERSDPIEPDRIFSLKRFHRGDIADRLQELRTTPNMLGFSKNLRRVRQQIKKIAEGVSDSSRDWKPLWQQAERVHRRQGGSLPASNDGGQAGAPGHSSPVIIFGPTGSGKEEVAQNLFRLSPRSSKWDMGAENCSWLAGDPTAALGQLFGQSPGVYTGVLGRRGILEIHKNGAVFLDEIDSAPVIVQAQLLRMLADRDFVYHRYNMPGDIERPHKDFAKESGDYDERALREITKNEQFIRDNIHKPGFGMRATDAWLIFATNVEVKELLRTRNLRSDLLYRCEDRVITLAGLANRPADISPIAMQLWRDAGIGSRKLVPAHLRNLVDRTVKNEIDWDGNVRALRTLVGLVGALAQQPGSTNQTTSSLFETVLARGKGLLEWLEIVTQPEFFEPPLLAIPDPRDLVKARLRREEGEWERLENLAEDSLTGKKPKPLKHIEKRLTDFCRILELEYQLGRYPEDKEMETATGLRRAIVFQFLTKLGSAGFLKHPK